MRRTGLAICSALLGVITTGPVALADRIPLQERPAYQQAGYEVMAVVANFVPVRLRPVRTQVPPGIHRLQARVRRLQHPSRRCPADHLRRSRPRADQGHSGARIRGRLDTDQRAHRRRSHPGALPRPAPPAAKTFTPPPQ